LKPVQILHKHSLGALRLEKKEGTMPTSIKLEQPQSGVATYKAATVRPTYEKTLESVEIVRTAILGLRAMRKYAGDLRVHG
jgi:hypothetical protein